MSVQVLRGNALQLPLADDSVDLVVTSPPYFGLRSYQDGGAHYDGQIGDEATPAEFVDALVAATREMVRVVKPSGSIWVNLGDKYSGGKGGYLVEGGGYDGKPVSRPVPGMRPKTLIGIPWRYALRCIDDLGLILRAEVIWSKPNGLPESVTDRVRRSHETWFHFVLNPRYYSAVDEIREESAVRNDLVTTEQRRQMFGDISANRAAAAGKNVGTAFAGNPLGKLPSSVWSINEGDSLVRSVLSAVASQGITPDEGERILLWTRSNDSCGTSESLTRDAGNGSSGATPAATPRSASAVDGKNSSTESPMSSTSGRSPKDSPSTTSAATPAASGPTTSSPSLSARTSGEPTLSGSPAGTDTLWPTPTPTSHPQASTTRSAAPAPSSGSDVGESVWQVPTQPLKVPPELGIDHFAAFPLEFPRRIVTGWSPREVCTACGEGRRPVLHRVTTGQDNNTIAMVHGREQVGSRMGGAARSGAAFNAMKAAGGGDRITGYACACPDTTAHTTPGTVLDPFGGTGTTALVAHALGRHGISVDMSADYCRLAQWRTTDPKELARAQQREYVPPREQVAGQDAFDFGEATA